MGTGHRSLGPAQRAHKRGGWPDRNAEYLLYQTLVGAWPIGPVRAGVFMAKATREAKVHTSWTDPCAEYDEALSAFVSDVLADQDFVADLESVPGRAPARRAGPGQLAGPDGAAADLPGVPDLYQGTELWDLSLVDPDNRGPSTTRRAAACSQPCPAAGRRRRVPGVTTAARSSGSSTACCSTGAATPAPTGLTRATSRCW